MPIYLKKPRRHRARRNMGWPKLVLTPDGHEIPAADPTELPGLLQAFPGSKVVEMAGGAPAAAPSAQIVAAAPGVTIEIPSLRVPAPGTRAGFAAPATEAASLIGAFGGSLKQTPRASQRKAEAKAAGATGFSGRNLELYQGIVKSVGGKGHVCPGVDMDAYVVTYEAVLDEDGDPIVTKYGPKKKRTSLTKYGQILSGMGLTPAKAKALKAKMKKAGVLATKSQGSHGPEAQAAAREMLYAVEGFSCPARVKDNRGHRRGGRRRRR